MAFILAGSRRGSAADAPPSEPAGPGGIAKVSGKLPKEILPTHYAVTLTVDPARPDFSGSETIAITLRQPSQTLTLNAKDLTIDSVRLDETAAPVRVSLSPANEQLHLLFARPIPAGNHRLQINWRGKIGESQRGLYAVTYRERSQPTRLLVTQFEATDARRMLPCWDEPAYKAVYQLTVRAPGGLSIISNTSPAQERSEGNQQLVQFRPTPRMSSYLLMLAVGHLETVSQDAGGVRVSIVTRPGQQHKARLALDSATAALRYYTEYFGTPYPLPKLDIVGVPLSGIMAMENWGAIVIPENYLLIDSATGGEDARELLVQMVTHEVAHQWFGNLVTMAWWDDLWLNESYTDWMMNKVTDRLHPNWHIWQQYRGGIESAMDRDAYAITHPIANHVSNDVEADLAFDEITYEKGAAFLYMLEAYVGEDQFRASVRSYMQRFQYGSATTDDLWSMLQTVSGKPIAAIARDFTLQRGLALVKVQERCSDGMLTLELSQERLRTDGAKDSTRWHIPLQLARSDGTARQSFLLDGQGRVTLPGCALPVLVNAGGAGYFRVQYDAATATQLAERFGSLAGPDKQTLLNDSWALIRLGRLSVEHFFALLDRIGTETDVGTWRRVIKILRSLDRLQRGQPLRPAFREYARAILRPVLTRLGFTPQAAEPSGQLILREEAIIALGFFEDGATLAEAHRRFAEPDKLPASIRRGVYAAVAQDGDAATYQALLARAQSVEDEIERTGLYQALAVFREPALLQRALALASSPDVPGPVGAQMLIAAAQDSDQLELVWSRTRAACPKLYPRLDAYLQNRLLPVVAKSGSDPARIRELYDAARTCLPADAKPELDNAAAEIAFNARLKLRLLPALQQATAARRKGSAQ